MIVSSFMMVTPGGMYAVTEISRIHTKMGSRRECMLILVSLSGEILFNSVTAACSIFNIQ